MMREHRTWEQMAWDNAGADWIKDGAFCAEYNRTSGNEDVEKLRRQYRTEGLQEWQMPGFNGCWSCDKSLTCQYNAEVSEQ